MTPAPPHEHPEIEARLPPNGGRLAVVEERTANLQSSIREVKTILMALLVGVVASIGGLVVMFVQGAGDTPK